MSDANKLEPGSGAARIAMHLQHNPNATLDRHDVALLISVAIGAVDKLLDPGVAIGLLTIANDTDRGRLWRAGPRLKFWTPAGDAPAPAPAPASPAPAAKKTTRGGRQPRLPLLDINAYPVQRDVPLPAPKICRRGETRYDAVFDALTANGMCRVGLPIAYRSSINKACQVYLKRRPDLAKVCVFWFRDLDNDTFGIWRQARTTQQAA
jgi:hypothetical protein